jgi:hypothetical protein
MLYNSSKQQLISELLPQSLSVDFYGLFSFNFERFMHVILWLRY